MNKRYHFIARTLAHILPIVNQIAIPAVSPAPERISPLNTRRRTISFVINQQSLKEKLLFGLGVGLSTLFASALPSFAQSQRYPTNAEIQKLTEQLQKQTQITTDNPTATETKKRSSFIKAWSAVNKSIAPFLGSWRSILETSYTQSLMIYPSKSGKQVCIIHGDYPDSDQLTTFSFAVGSLSNDQIRLEGSLGQTIVFKKGNHLGLAGIYKNKPEVFKYSFPKPLQQPAPALMDNRPEASTIIQKFKAAGCTVSLP